MGIKSFKTYRAIEQKLDMDSIKEQALNFNTTEPYLKAIDSLNISIIILNSYRQIVYSNKAYLKLLNVENISDILGQKLGETLNCINAFKSKEGCGTSIPCRNCGACNIILKSINVNEETEDEISITRKIGSFDMPLNLFEKVIPIEINYQVFYMVSFIDATDSVMRRTMEKIFFHDLINTAGALKGIINLLKTDVPSIYENEVAQVEGLFEELIDEIQSQRQILAAQNNELCIDMQKFNSKEILIKLKKLYQGYSNSINKSIKVDEGSINVDLKNDISILKRVIGNMLRNALEATEEDGTVIMGCDKGKNDYVKYWVKNSNFISEEVQNNIFKRGFSTKGKNRGLGTYSMKLLGEKYLKGLVGFTSSKYDGTCFYIEIQLEINEGVM